MSEASTPLGTWPKAYTKIKPRDFLCLSPQPSSKRGATLGIWEKQTKVVRKKEVNPKE